jgi:hypothetical protein
MYILLIIIIISAVLLYKTYMKRDVENSFQNNLKKIKNKFGGNIAKNVERIYRLETNHFKSGQFQNTYSPGMESFANAYPYGWNTISNIFWNNYPIHAPVGFYSGKEGKTGKTKIFLKFPSLLSAMYTIAYFLQHYNNNPGRWYSTKTESQNRYNKSINKIKTPLYDSI